MGKEGIHFEAPAAKKLDPKMGAFLDWFDGSTEGDWVVKAGMAHLWFVTIHPFEDGNGRIARAIADKSLARSEQSSQRFYSMSAQIRQERADYYDIPERTQKATMDITPWMDWLLGCLGRAIEGAQATLGTVLSKAHLWGTPC
jgi:Fic family protein